MNLGRSGSTLALVGVCLTLFLSLNSVPAARVKLDLRGNWDFYPDVGASPLESVAVKPGKIIVPGAWQAQGYGTPGGTIPSANIGPGTSPAEYLRHNLMGRCLYVRDVVVPAEWRGQRVFLCVRRAYRYADIAVNGKRAGEHEGFSSPFEFDITKAISFGASNQLVIGIDNRPRPGRDTLGTGNLYGHWGGIGGAVYLEARAPSPTSSLPRWNFT
jgi:beta-galactosidase/beta-glucuronidase